MNDIARLLAVPLLALPACVTNSNRCVAGYEFAPQYDACLADDSGADRAQSDAPSPPDGGPREASAAEGGALPADSRREAADAGAAADAKGTMSTGLGVTCQESSDCHQTADYCLKSPLAPTDPGICTIVHCTSTSCTAAYSCCDCTASAVSSLQAFPRGVCVPVSNESQLAALGCVCQ